jgi:hypothetical protein
MRAALFLGLVAMSTSAMAADQFDLVCTAKKTMVRYRVDLTRGEWCFDQCKLVQKLAEVTAGEIVLIRDKPLSPRDSETENRISRSDGSWYWYNYSPRTSVVPNVTKGVCEPAAFSGFPTNKF